MGKYEEEAKAREKEEIAENNAIKAILRKYDLAMLAARLECDRALAKHDEKYKK